MMATTWDSPAYRETALIVLGILFFSGILVYFLRKRNHYFIVSWASIKSWLVVAPILFLIFSFPWPSPLIALTVLALLGAKVFFQLMGMYHRSWFVIFCYLGIIGLGLSAYYERTDLYNLMPMIMFGATCLIPLIRNNYKHMIQYISLTNLSFIFLGWSFMHLALILKFEGGLYQFMYLIILTEFCDNTTLAISRYIGSIKLFDRIDSKRTFEAFVLSAFLTVAFAFGMRHLLPDQSDIYWLAAGLVASIGGFLGDMVMTVVRKDAGIKIVGPFIIGRGDFLHRMDRLIFVAPIYYYVMLWLSQGAS